MKSDLHIYIIAILFIALMIFLSACHRVPSCPLCDEPAIKCNADHGRTLLRCENNHLWYQ